ncbi:MAG: TlpA family protein disulfide reductase [Chloroflexota bacterium]
MMPLWKRLTYALIASVLIAGAILLLAGAGLPQRADFTGYRLAGAVRPVAPEPDALAPPFTLDALNGEPVTLWDLRGQPVVVNFWATWCAPCLAEMPELQALYDAHAADGLRVLAVNLGEPADAVRAWADALGLRFDMLLDPSAATAQRYYLRGYPSTFIVSPGGVIVRVFHGPVRMADLQAALTPYLAG